MQCAATTLTCTSADDVGIEACRYTYIKTLNFATHEWIPKSPIRRIWSSMSWRVQSPQNFRPQIRQLLQSVLVGASFLAQTKFSLEEHLQAEKATVVAKTIHLLITHDLGWYLDPPITYTGTLQLLSTNRKKLPCATKEASVCEPMTITQHNWLWASKRASSHNSMY